MTASSCAILRARVASRRPGNSQPGVDALGYVNSTTPDLLSSTSFFSVVLSPSLVSTSPPKSSRLTTSPTATCLALLAGTGEAAAAAGSFLGAAAFLGATAVLGAAAVAFLGRGAGAGSGALRLRSVGGIATGRDLRELN